MLSARKSPPQPLCSSKEDSERVANEVTWRTQLNGEDIGAIVEASTSNGDASVVHLKQGCRESGWGRGLEHIGAIEQQQDIHHSL